MRVRKKPVEVSAWRVDLLTYLHNSKHDTELPPEVREANKAGILTFGIEDLSSNSPKEVIYVHTLEGVMRAEPTDYLIQGVKGEFYPCKDDIFKATYEVVDSEVNR